MSIIDQLNHENCIETSQMTTKTISNESQESQDSGLRLQSGTSAKRAPPRRFRKSFVYKSGQRLLKFRLNEISNRNIVRTIGTQINSFNPAETDFDTEGAQNPTECCNYLNGTVDRQIKNQC